MRDRSELTSGRRLFMMQLVGTAAYSWKDGRGPLKRAEAFLPLEEGGGRLRSGVPGVIDVTAFGARRDGVTDDTGAIQSALDAASDGSIVYWPPGTYMIEGAPTLRGTVSGLTLWGYGATIMLKGRSACAVRFAVGARQEHLTIAGLTVVGSGRVEDDQQAIGSIVTTGGVSGSQLRIMDCTASDVARGIFIEGEITGVRIEGCSVQRAVGTSPHTGYGVVLGSLRGGVIADCHFEACQRHACYVSVCSDVSVVGNRFASHRAANATGKQMPACNIARSSSVTVIGNSFTECADGAIAFLPDERPEREARGMTATGNTFRDSVGVDVWIGSPTLAGNGPFSNVILSGNTFVRTNPSSPGGECVRLYGGRNVTISGNSFYVNHPGQASQGLVVVGASGAQLSYTDNVEIHDNVVSAEVSPGGRLYFVFLMSAQCAGRSAIGVTQNSLDCSGAGVVVGFESKCSASTVRVRRNVVGGIEEVERPEGTPSR